MNKRRNFSAIERY